MFLEIFHQGILSSRFRNRPPEVFPEKGDLKICREFTEEQPCRSDLNLIESALLHGFSLVNLLNILRTPFPKNTSEGCFCRFQTTYLINTQKRFSVLYMNHYLQFRPLI